MFWKCSPPDFKLCTFLDVVSNLMSRVRLFLLCSRTVSVFYKPVFKFSNDRYRNPYMHTHTHTHTVHTAVVATKLKWNHQHHRSFFFFCKRYATNFSTRMLFFLHVTINTTMTTFLFLHIDECLSCLWNVDNSINKTPGISSSSYDDRINPGS